MLPPDAQIKLEEKLAASSDGNPAVHPVSFCMPNEHVHTGCHHQPQRSRVAAPRPPVQIREGGSSEKGMASVSHKSDSSSSDEIDRHDGMTKLLHNRKGKMVLFVRGSSSGSKNNDAAEDSDQTHNTGTSRLGTSRLGGKTTFF